MRGEQLHLRRRASVGFEPGPKFELHANYCRVRSANALMCTPLALADGVETAPALSLVLLEMQMAKAGA